MVNELNFVMLESKRNSYHPFSLIHYIAIKSFLVNNPELLVYIHTNMDIEQYTWFIILKEEFESRISLITPKDSVLLEDSLKEIDNFDSLAHLIDRYRFKRIYEEGGLWMDLDEICLRPLENIIYEYKFCTPVETDPITWKPRALACGWMYAPRYSPISKAFYESHLNYTKGKPWGYYGVEMIYKIYNDWVENNDPLINEIHLISESLTDPSTWTHDKAIDLFLHNNKTINNGINYTLHVSESLFWDRHLKRLDLEHIMTVDTNFTRAVRCFVENLWDKKYNKPLITEFK